VACSAPPSNCSGLTDILCGLRTEALEQRRIAFERNKAGDRKGGLVALRRAKDAQSKFKRGQVKERQAVLDQAAAAAAQAACSDNDSRESCSAPKAAAGGTPTVKANVPPAAGPNELAAVRSSAPEVYSGISQAVRCEACKLTMATLYKNLQVLAGHNATTVSGWRLNAEGKRERKERALELTDSGILGAMGDVCLRLPTIRPTVDVVFEETGSLFVELQAAAKAEDGAETGAVLKKHRRRPPPKAPKAPKQGPEDSAGALGERPDATEAAREREGLSKGPAEAAGVLPGDVLVAVGGGGVKDRPFREIVALVKGGDRPLRMRFARRGATQSQKPSAKHRKACKALLAEFDEDIIEAVQTVHGMEALVVTVCGAIACSNSSLDSR
jgi:hypothetical protein